MTTKKILNEDGQELVDGKPVELYELKFKGSAELDQEIGAPISAGDVITAVVTLRIDPPKYTNVKGELKRTNVGAIEQLEILDKDLAIKFLDVANIEFFGLNAGVVIEEDDLHDDPFGPESSQPVVGAATEAYDNVRVYTPQNGSTPVTEQNRGITDDVQNVRVI